jgi:hypothetical protein
MKQTLNIITGGILMCTLIFAFSFAVVGTAHAQLYDDNNDVGVSATGTVNNNGNGVGTTATTATATPGLPETGVGGDAAISLAIILTSLAVFVGGSLLLARKFV